MNLHQLEILVLDQVSRLAEQASIDINLTKARITRPKHRQHGDFSCNLALRLADKFSMTPLALAEKLADRLSQIEGISSVSAVKPGFINFFVNQSSHRKTLLDILKQGNTYGSQAQDKGRLLLEFVSSNPTGPLHIGHGRGAAYGASLANILRFYGYQVECEYYLNDAGRQISILAISLWIRYLQQADFTIDFPAGGYQGQYLIDLAKKLYDQQPKRWLPTDLDLSELNTNINDDQQLDKLIEQSKGVLGADLFDSLKRDATQQVTDIIKNDLKDFGVEFDNWFNEQSLYEKGSMDTLFEELEQAKSLYHKDSALWFKTTKYGDDKDRVIRRANGEYTYFATDIAYHDNKFNRGFDLVINIFGADHHGYTTRLKAAITELGHDPNKFEICLLQLANLIQDNEKISMSTRAGRFVELTDLIEEIGKDAARFFYLLRRHDQHLDFDLSLAKQRSKENPVYYVQYAHARVIQIIKQAQSQSKIFNQEQAKEQFNQLDSDAEQTLLDKLARFPEIVELAAMTRSPHIICQYTRELAALFHNYYASTKILDYEQCWQARVWLSLAVQQVLANALNLIGVNAPEHM